MIATVTFEFPLLFTVIITLCNILFFLGIDLYLVALSSLTECLCREINKSGKFRDRSLAVPAVLIYTRNGGMVLDQVPGL